jgi:hypothetical protein
LIFEAWWFDSPWFFVCVSQARAWMPRRGQRICLLLLHLQIINLSTPEWANLHVFQLLTISSFSYTNCTILWCWSWGSHQLMNQESFDHLLSAQLFFSPRKKDCRWVLINKTSS